MGGSSDSASKEAARAEKERQAAIKNSQDRINAVFDSPSRKADIASFVDAMREYFGNDLSRQKEENDRQLKFALARGGQIGGSTQIDQQRRLGEDYQRGVLEVDRKARGAGAQLETADQENRLSLISSATQGLDATTGASQAASAMRNALQAGKSAALADGLGDVFSGFKNYYQKSQEAAVRRRADKDAYGSWRPSATIFGGP